MIVQVRGQRFASVQEAARAFGVTEKTVYSAVSIGRADSIGLGKGKHANRVSPRAQPFSIGPHSWPSKTKAAIALGYRPATLHKIIRNGRMDEILARAMQVLK